MFGFIQFIYNITLTGFGLIGLCTVLHKSGKFLKTIEEAEKDGYKKAFDQFIVQTIEEFQFSLDSVNILTKNSLHMAELMIDLISGKKVIQKDKDGKIMITEKSLLQSEYKEQIEILTMKLKKYQDKMDKMKKKKHVEESDESSDEEESDNTYELEQK